MVAGLHTWRTFSFSVFHVNPPLVRTIATGAVAPCLPKCDMAPCFGMPCDRREWSLGEVFMSANDAEHIRWYFSLARWTCIPFCLLGGYMCYWAARSLYGEASGYCALTLWCFSPFVLGYGASICPEVASSAMGIAAIWVFRKWLTTSDWSQAFLAGLTLGILMLTKLTWVVVLVLWPVIWLAWRFGPRSMPTSSNAQSAGVVQLAAILAIALAVINLGYGFEGSFQPLGEYEFVSKTLSGIDNSTRGSVPNTGNRLAGMWLGGMPVPLPANFIQGIDTQRYDFECGLPSYLHGQWADHGWWYYYLYALAIKMPLGTWGLALLAVVATVARRDCNASWRDEMILLLPFFSILIFVSSQTGFSIHSRYIIPALPFLFVWMSKVGRVFEGKSWQGGYVAKRIVVGAAIVWSVGSSLWYYPHSLSYFNELVGGPMGGPRHLLDSNIDWGQDLFYLKDWLDAHPEVRLDGLAYWGSCPVTIAGIPETPLPPTILRSADKQGMKAGWYALSVNYIYGRDRQYRHFLNYEPVATAGYSIYIYHITPEQTKRGQCELARKGCEIGGRPSTTVTRTGP
jgi:hypothetical protein